MAGGGPRFSEVGFGGWEAGGGRTWGDDVSDRDVVDAIRSAVRSGVNWLDTAEVYGGGGGSERVIAQAVARDPEVLICTKAGPRPDGSGVRGDELKPSLERSLRRLGRDAVDVYYVHWPDPTVPLEETWGAMAELVEQGLARYIGLSNFSPSDVERCHRQRRVDCIQIQGSCLYVDEIDALGRWCTDEDVRIVCYGPLAYGILADAVRLDDRFSDWRSGAYGMDDFFVKENYERFFAPEQLRRHLAVVDALRPLADAAETTVAQLALAWLLAREDVAGVIAGTRSSAHAVENAAAGALTLAPQLVQAVTAALRG
jgi:aryl-alcohol dehydrogenase-like predicted oxidoreductase